MYTYQQPDPTGHFGIYGGSFVSETLTHAINELKDAYARYQHDPAFLAEFRRSHALQRQLHNYIYTLMSQITQTAACNRFHVVEARLARWLLMTQDRTQSNPFRLTQEFLAQMLGVRRVGVTKAAHALQKDRLISYSRGNITILDRKGLEAASCSCYEVVKDMHQAA